MHRTVPMGFPNLGGEIVQYAHQHVRRAAFRNIRDLFGSGLAPSCRMRGELHLPFKIQMIAIHLEVFRRS